MAVLVLAQHDGKSLEKPHSPRRHGGAEAGRGPPAGGGLRHGRRRRGRGQGPGRVPRPPRRRPRLRPADRGDRGRAAAGPRRPLRRGPRRLDHLRPQRPAARGRPARRGAAQRHRRRAGARHLQALRLRRQRARDREELDAKKVITVRTTAFEAAPAEGGSARSRPRRRSRPATSPRCWAARSAAASGRT